MNDTAPRFRIRDKSLWERLRLDDLGAAIQEKPLPSATVARAEWAGDTGCDNPLMRASEPLPLQTLVWFLIGSGGTRKWHGSCRPFSYRKEEKVMTILPADV